MYVCMYVCIYLCISMICYFETYLYLTYVYFLTRKRLDTFGIELSIGRGQSIWATEFVRVLGVKTAAGVPKSYWVIDVGATLLCMGNCDILSG